MIHVPGCTSVLLFVTLNHTLSQIWVLLLRGMRGFRLSLLDLVLFYKRLLKKSLQYLHALRTNRLAMVYQNTSEDNITQQPRVPGETQLAITESVNTRIGVVEGLAKIDEENAKIAAAEVLLKSFWAYKITNGYAFVMIGFDLYCTGVYISKNEIKRCRFNC